MRLSALFIILCATLCAVHVPVYAAEKAGPDIAVLRLDEVIRNSKVFTARVDQLKSDQAAAAGVLAQMAEQLKALDNILKVLTPTSEKFYETQVKFEQVKVEYDMKAKYVNSQLDTGHGAALIEAYDIARGHLKDFAKERGIRLVTLAPDPQIPPMSANKMKMSANDIQVRLGFQVTLYFDDQLDITEAFIAFMNSRYEGAAPAAPSVGPVPGPTPATPPKP